MHSQLACSYRIVTTNRGHRRIQRASLTPPELKQYLLRVAEEVNRGFPTPCWEWRGQKSPRNYGVITHQHKGWRVHRLMWFLLNGEIGKGVEICHHCDNPACYNPGHLFAGSHSDNMKDAAKKGRLKNPCGEASGVSKLKTADVVEIRKLYSPGRYRSGKRTATELANRFGVSKNLIYLIAHKRIWKHV